MKALFIPALLLAISTATPALDLAAIPDNTFAQVTPISYTFPSGYAGSFYLRFWCNFTWDSDSNRILFYEGDPGDHGQTGGAIYANAIWAFTPATSTVRMLNLSNWDNPSYDHFTAGSGAANPHPRHTYGGFKYVSKYKSLFLGFGACAHDVTCASGDLWQFNFQNQSWTEIGKPLPADGQIGENVYTSQFSNLPGSDTLWIFAPRSDGSGWVNIYSFNLATHVWSAKLNYGTAVANLVHAAEDPLRKRILVWNHNSVNTFSWFLPLSGQLKALPSPPTGLGNAGKMAYVSKYDCFVIYDGAKVWRFNPSDSTWAQLAAASVPGSRIDDYYVYDPVNDVIAMFDVTGKYWVFRYTDGTAIERKISQSEVPVGIAPNPFHSALTIRVNDLNADIRLFTVDGKCMAASHGKTLQWDGTNQAAGIYMVKVRSRGKEAVSRLVLLK